MDKHEHHGTKHHEHKHNETKPKHTGSKSKHNETKSHAKPHATSHATRTSSSSSSSRDHSSRMPTQSSSHAKILMALGIIIVLIAVYNSFQIASLGGILDEKVVEAKEAAIPAEVQVIVLLDSECKSCMDVSTVVDSLKRLNVNVTKEDSISFDDAKAEKLLNKYGVDKVPAVIILGEVDKINPTGFESVDDALVFMPVKAPYTDSKSGEVQGLVSAVIIKDSSCEECSDLTAVISGLKQTGIQILSESTVEKNSQEGRSLISKYDVETLPTLVFSKDLGAYGSELTDNWAQVGTVESDGSYVTRITIPPYRNLDTGKVVGLVDMTVLVDKSCDKCYDPDTFHKPILQNMGVVFGSEKRVDVSSAAGKSLVDEYKITKVPTVVLEGDMDEYASLKGAWKDVGSVETDGTYVFRNVEVIRQPYKDLVTGQVVGVAAAAAN